MPTTRKSLPVALIACLSCISSVRGADEQAIRDTSDVFKHISDTVIYVAPMFAYGMALGARDWTGVKQFSLSAGMSMGITAALKYSVNNTRPNGEPYSFPSGHMAIMVSSAEFLRKRYGWQYGVPVYGFALYVGYERVREDEHRPVDIAAGAAIAFASTYWLTKPNEDWFVQPLVEAKTKGIKVTRRF